MLRRSALILAGILLVLSVWPGLLNAQGGGQFCVRSFEDRNGNGQRDTGEPLLTGGVGANLLNAEGIVIASALLEDAPTAAQGFICFQFLGAGQYTMALSSPDFNPTTPDTTTTFVDDSGPPTVVEFGAQRLDAQPGAVSGTSSGTGNTDDTLERLIVSAIGGLVVVAAMAVLGMLVYFFAFSTGKPPQAAPYPGTRETISIETPPDSTET